MLKIRVIGVLFPLPIRVTINQGETEMSSLILLLFAVGFIIWWSYQYNRDLPQGEGRTTSDRRLFNRFRRRDSGRQIQEWATLSSLHEEQPLFQGLPEEKQQAFNQWLKNLDEAEVRALTGRIEEFCKASRLDLHGLMNGNAQKDPILAEGIGAGVVAYLIAYFEAHEIQDRAAAFDIYEKWQRNPAGRRNRPLTQDLFDQLSEQGSVPALPANMALASHRKRISYLIAAIQNAAERDIGLLYNAIENIEREKTSAPSGIQASGTRVRYRLRRQPTAAAAVEATA